VTGVRRIAWTREIANLTTAIAQGSDLPSLTAVKTAQARRDDLAATITADEAIDVTRFDRALIERKVRQHLDRWQGQLRKHVEVMRQVLREVLVGPLTLTPDGGTYRFGWELLVGSLLRGSDDLQPSWRARLDSNQRPPA